MNTFNDLNESSVQSNIAQDMLSSSAGLASVTDVVSTLQWSAGQAFENLKFMDQKAAVLAGSIGIFGAKVLELLVANWAALERPIGALCILGVLLLVISLGACLTVLLPRGRFYNSRSDARYLAYVDADVAAARTQQETKGAKRLIFCASSENVTTDVRSAGEEWLEAYFSLVRNRGLNASAKGDYFRRALYALFGAVSALVSAVVIHAFHIF